MVWAQGAFFGSSGGYPPSAVFHQLTHNTSRGLDSSPSFLGQPTRPPGLHNQCSFTFPPYPVGCSMAHSALATAIPMLSLVFLWYSPQDVSCWDLLFQVWTRDSKVTAQEILGSLLPLASIMPAIPPAGTAGWVVGTSQLFSHVPLLSSPPMAVSSSNTTCFVALDHRTMSGLRVDVVISSWNLSSLRRSTIMSHSLIRHVQGLPTLLPLIIK